MKNKLVSSILMLSIITASTVNGADDSGNTKRLITTAVLGGVVIGGVWKAYKKIKQHFPHPNTPTLQDLIDLKNKLKAPSDKRHVETKAVFLRTVCDEADKPQAFLSCTYHPKNDPVQPSDGSVFIDKTYYRFIISDCLEPSIAARQRKQRMNQLIPVASLATFVVGTAFIWRNQLFKKS